MLNTRDVVPQNVEGSVYYEEVGGGVIDMRVGDDKLSCTMVGLRACGLCRGSGVKVWFTLLDIGFRLQFGTEGPK